MDDQSKKSIQDHIKNVEETMLRTDEPIVIKWNCADLDETCGLCDQPVQVEVGPALFVEGKGWPVCGRCGWLEAALLSKILELLKLAERYSFWLYKAGGGLIKEDQDILLALNASEQPPS